MDRETKILLLFGLVLAGMVTLVHVRVIDLGQVAAQMELHAQIVRHAAPAPYQYRVLQPFLVEAALRLDGGRHYYAVFLGAYGLLRFLATVVVIVAFFAFLRRSFSRVVSAAGVLLLLACLPFTFWNYYYQPTSIVELTVFALALLLAARRALLPLLLVVFIATFNRETTVFVSALWILWWLKSSPRAAWSGGALLGVAWLLPFMALRAIYPAPMTLLNIPYYLNLNLANRWGMVDVFCMTVPWFAWLCWKERVPAVYRRLLPLWFAWIALHFVTAQWWEVRYYLPLVMANIPPLLAGLAPAVHYTPDHRDTPLPVGSENASVSVS